jgi:hypothetical protein
MNLTRLVVLASVGFAFTSALNAQSTLLVDIRELTPHELRSEGFSLPNAQEIRIDAVGASEGRSGIWIREAGRDEYWRGNAWILNARTREVVWELRRADTRSTRKGVERFDGSLQLPAGEYEVYYASYSALWRIDNSALRWVLGRKAAGFNDDGLSEDFLLHIRGEGRRLNYSELARLRDSFRSDAVVTLTSVRPQESAQLGFELSKPTQVDIYAIGELNEDQSYDYGYIINADTHQKVWSFDYRQSRPAGGALKNRMARETRTLPAGRYAAIYAMDDSHDPNEWNAAPPLDPNHWGLTVRVRPEDRANVKTFAYDPTPNDQAIVALTRMRDGETRSLGFTLSKPLDVRVYALGEGTDGQMHDYGWIIDAASRRHVWTMDYSRTEHAGGAQKNRLADQVVKLDAGSYLVYFQTDDSHSYRNWNSSPPIGGDDWGISLFPASGQLDRSAIAPFDETKALSANALVQILGVGDDEERSRTFTLDQDTDVRIYALGEGSDNQMFDYAWIEKVRTDRVVWEMTYRMTSHAGGASKNRLYDDVIRLPAGQYVLRYKSDDSHSADSWNADAPYDPARWGVTLFKATK